MQLYKIKKNSTDFLHVKPLRGIYTMGDSFSTKPYRLRRMENWSEQNSKYQIVKTLKKDSKRIMWQDKLVKRKLNVIFGTTNMFSELCLMPYILNQLNYCWPRFRPALSNPKHGAKICVSEVKFKFMNLKIFIFSILKIKTAPIMLTITSQEKHTVQWLIHSSLIDVNKYFYLIH